MMRIRASGIRGACVGPGYAAGSSRACAKTSGIFRAMVATCCVAATASGSAKAQAPAGLTLARPIAVLEHIFGKIDGVRELVDGRVVILDSQARKVHVADLAAQRVVRLSWGVGSSGDYVAPLFLHAQSRNETAVYDGATERLLFLTGGAEPGDVVSTAGVATAAGLQVARFLPIAADTLGRFYSRGPSTEDHGRGLILLDSVAIRRWDRVSGGFDTVAFVRNRSLKDRGGEYDAGRAVVEALIPFTPGDQWAVDAGGTVAILRFDTYRVELVGEDGARVVGPPLPFRAFPVTEAEKELCRRERDAFAGCRVVAPDRNPPAWRTELPPFFLYPARFAADGTLWVERAGPATIPPSYDLIDRTGGLIATVRLPMGSRVVAVGTRGVYVAHQEPDGQVLQLFSATGIPHH